MISLVALLIMLFTQCVGTYWAYRHAMTSDNLPLFFILMLTNFLACYLLVVDERSNTAKSPPRHPPSDDPPAFV